MPAEISTLARKTRRRPQARKRFANKEKTRRAILKAAPDLFARHGFYRTTTKAILRKARIAEGTLFNYFQTKEDLALCYGQAVKHRLTNPEFVFVSRVELGLCNLLHQLKARVNTRKIWERVHKQATRNQ